MKKLENQVCPFEQSFELCFYKFNVEPCFYWYLKNDKSKPVLVTYKSKHVLKTNSVYPAYTVAEMGEILLLLIDKYSVYIFPKEHMLFNGRDEFGTCEAMSEAELRAEMLLRALRCKKIKFG